jgi:hypothetical protein
MWELLWNTSKIIYSRILNNFTDKYLRYLSVKNWSTTTHRTETSCSPNRCFKHFALTSVADSHPSLNFTHFPFNALWLAAHLNAAGRIRNSRRRTKLWSCAPTANYVSHRVLAIQFRPRGLFAFICLFCSAYERHDDTPSRGKKLTRRCTIAALILTVLTCMICG